MLLTTHSLSKIYDELYDEADKLFKQYDPCNIHLNQDNKISCYSHHNNGNKWLCCGGCCYWDKRILSIFRKF